MKWNIVADSSCDIYELEGLCEEANFSTIPFQINIGDKVYTDDENLDISEMMSEMYAFKGAVNSACPSPSQWEEEFMRADMSIAVTITGSLSGSNSSANVAARNVLQAHPEKKIFVLNSLSAGGEIALILKNINELIKKGLSFEEVVKATKDFASRSRLIFALTKFSNLIKTGRLNKLAGYAAELIALRAIGTASVEGKLKMLNKARGDNKLINAIVSEMEKSGFDNGEVMIGHCFNEKSATVLKNAILKKWEDAKVTLFPTRGLCSFYAEENGLMLGYYSNNMPVFNM